LIDAKLPDEDGDDYDDDRQPPAGKDVEYQRLSSVCEAHEVDPESNSLGKREGEREDIIYYGIITYMYTLKKLRRYTKT
jgi:hypothetical protein